MKERATAISVLAGVAAVPALLAWYTLDFRPSTYPPGVRVIDLTGVAARGVWTLEPVNNLNYWWKAFEPATIYLTLNDSVVLRLHSADVLHQFYLPALDIGPLNVEAGHVTEASFKADREGAFQFYCTSLCGNCHFYMTGWVVVTPPGEPPFQPDPVVCPLCTPDLGPPPEHDPVLLGEYLYIQMACGACHGTEGRGGIPNFNYLNGEITGHVRTAEKIFLRSEEDADALTDWIGAGGDSEDEDGGPDITGFRIVKARLEAARSLIRNGKNAAKADLDGPEPPLQMPAWRSRLNNREILAILSYFVSLYPWDEEDV